MPACANSRTVTSVLLAPAVLLVLFATFAAPAPARADSPYVQGLEYYRQGRYDDAVRVLVRSLPKPPEQPASHTAHQVRPQTPAVPSPVVLPPDSEEAPHVRAVLGFTLLRQNLLPEAEEQFSLVRRNPFVEPVGVLGAGWAAFARGRTSLAVELFSEALAKAVQPPAGGALPDMLRESVHVDARLGLGLIALGRGQAAEALRHLEAAASGPDVLGSPKELLLALGDARALTGNARGAFEAWSQVRGRASNFPGDAPRDELARLKTARLAESQGDVSRALGIYAELADGKHYKSEALLGQAKALLGQGRAGDALPVLRRVVAMDPDLAEVLAPAVQADPKLWPVNRDWGLAYFHNADYMEALSKLSAYLDDVDPRDAGATLGMAWSFLRLGHLTRAWDSFSDARGLRPQSAEPLVGMGAAAMALGRPDEARELIGRALSMEPGNALGLGTMGHLELSQGNSQKALEAFRAALKARPDYVDARLASARILYARAEYDAAAAEYFRLVTQEKRSVTGWNGLGWARFSLSQYQDALTAFAEARRLNPELPAGAYGMGVTLARMGRAEEAAKRLAEAAFLNPDFTASAEVLELMRGGRPEYAELYLELGESYARRLYPTTAAPYLEEYLRKNPNSRPGRRSLAWASFWAGQEDKAHALFQTLITVNKEDADAHLGDGLALLSRGHLDMAEPHLRDAVRLEPKSALAWRALTLLLLRQGKQQDAVNAQRQAPSSRQERLDRMSASGFAALSEGRVRDAVRDFRRAIALDPGLAAPHYGLAFAQVALGNPAQAREELLAGVNLDPAYLDEQELSGLISRHPELRALAGDLSWSQLYALNLPAARTGFEHILATSPANLEALFGLGATAYLQGDWALAESSFDKLMPRAPLTASSWDKWSHLMDKLGWSAYHQKKYDKALHAFDWLRTYTPETPYAAPLGGMGWSLMGKGSNQQALNLFARSLDIFPRNLTAMEGMRALKKAPETDDVEDMDDDPEPTPKVKGRKGKASRAAAVEERSAGHKEKKGKEKKPAKEKADKAEGAAKAEKEKPEKAKGKKAAAEHAPKAEKQSKSVTPAKAEGGEPKKVKVKRID